MEKGVANSKKLGLGTKVGVALILTIVIAVAVLFFSGKVVVITLVGVQEEYTVNPTIMNALTNITIKVYGATTFNRSVNLNDSYVHVFYAEDRGDFAFALIGVEDSDEPAKPDGWSDVLLPMFYSNAPNRGNTDYPIIFIDTAFSGSYAKEMWFHTKNGSELLFNYSVELGMRERGKSERVSVGYVEYDPVKDIVYMPAP